MIKIRRYSDIEKVPLQYQAQIKKHFNQIAFAYNCDVKEIRYFILDSWVIEQFCKVFFSEDSIRIITQGLNQNLKNRAENDEHYNRVKETLSRAKKSRDNLIDAIFRRVRTKL